MSFDNSLTLNNGSEASPHVLNVVRINQDGYSGEYRAKEGTDVFTFLIRHSTEKNKVMSAYMDRHNVTIRKVEAPTDTYPLGRVFEAYTVIRTPKDADAADILGLVTASCRFTLDHASRIVGWES